MPSIFQIFSSFKKKTLSEYIKKWSCTLLQKFLHNPAGFLLALATFFLLVFLVYFEIMLFLHIVEIINDPEPSLFGKQDILSLIESLGIIGLMIAPILLILQGIFLLVHSIMPLFVLFMIILFCVLIFALFPLFFWARALFQNKIWIGYLYFVLSVLVSASQITTDPSFDNISLFISLSVTVLSGIYLYKLKYLA